MVSKTNRQLERARRHARVRNKISGTAERPTSCCKAEKFSKTHRFSLQYNSGTDTIQSLQILSRPAPHNYQRTI